MKIEASQVSYAAAYASTHATVVSERTIVRARLADTDLALISSTGSRDDLADLDPQQRLVILAVEAILGHRIRLVRYRQPNATSPAPQTVDIRQRAELHYESEASSFRAEGVVATADGRQIHFSATLNMQREYQSVNASATSGDATDPLVVNFAGGPARLSGGKIDFDLDSDGEAESVSFTAAGSGFLMLDRDGDGKATNGGELFGPKTGNGFGELAAFDADGNGWIDEADPVFDKLRIWSAEGYAALREKGVGAIATTSVETPFALKDTANATLGQVRSSGVFLTEDGAAGTVQQVDLAV